MGKFIDSVLQWIKGLEGLDEKLGAALYAVVIALLVWVLQGTIKALVARYRNSKAARDLKPQFDYQAVQQATRYYIPTFYQNASPARQDEPGFTHQYVSRSAMIPFFIKTAFNEKADGERFYLILADSGMGKTTFMINLYIRYHSFFNWRRKYKMRLLRFSHPDTLSEIKAIKPEEARNTILLLDALDEDPNIVSRNPDITDAEAFQRRVDEIIEATRNFCEVVMTCRTQYFPGQEDDPYELKVKRPDEKGYYVLNKLYLSPFTNKEVRKYLNKKFGYLRFWNFAKKKRAEQIVGKAKHLVMRPMMLSYIDFLIDESRNFQFDYDIYETLVEKWLFREAGKRKGLLERDKFISNLRKVSQETAIEIYQNWRANNRLFLTKEEAVFIAQKNHIDLIPEEVTGQSLLTCDGEGHWKFAHKSIWEYFLVVGVLRIPGFFLKISFSGIDVVKRFFESCLSGNYAVVEGGKYSFAGSVVELSNFVMGKYPVTQLEYMEVSGFQNPSQFSNRRRCPVENVSWWDAIQFCNILNMNKGFSPVYDSKGNLLDPLGNITTDITQVRGFRLPTEAEWEFAARGGNKSKKYEFSGCNDIDEVAWYKKNSVKGTQIVGQKKPNELGLFDMCGNVWELCYDFGGEYQQGNRRNPVGPINGSVCAGRGGSWYHSGENCRLINRNTFNLSDRRNYLGFRLVFLP